MAGSCVFTGAYDKDPRGPDTSHSEYAKNSGPDGWRYLHLSALDGKLNQKTVEQFADCMGCPDCQRHFQELIKKMPLPDEEGKHFDTTVAWHNAVNKKTGKPVMQPGAARELWAKEGAKESAGYERETSQLPGGSGGGLKIAILISKPAHP